MCTVDPAPLESHLPIGAHPREGISRLVSGQGTRTPRATSILGRTP